MKAPLLFTLCHDVSFTVVIVVLFLVYLVLAKHYKLRERNKEINIQAIVETITRNRQGPAA